MSRLRVFDDGRPAQARFDSREHAAIAEALGRVGVRFERWAVRTTMKPGAPAEEVISAYRADIDRLMAAEGYTTVDVVSLHPEHPDRDVFRKKFLDEHTHSEDEVRFFVAGSGLFTLHLQGSVYEVVCEQGDLIGVPEGTPHWFDMGPRPSFVALRFFTNPAGWVAQFTGSDIATRFGRFEPPGSPASPTPAG